MSAGHQPKSHLVLGVTAPASATTEVCKLTINNEMRLNLVVDCYLGQVASTPALKLQDSLGYAIWTDVKSATLSASSDQTVTVSGATWTAASHGFTNGQMLTINSSGNVPGGVQLNKRYFAANVTTNTFELTELQNSNAVSIVTTDSGTGTLKVTAATVITFRVNAEVAGDQSVCPIRPQGRIAVVATGGQTAQVLDVRTGYCY